MGGVGRVEIDDVFNSAFGDETEVVDGEIAVWVDNAVTLIVENVGEGEKFEKSRFAGAGLTDNINMARTVATKKSKLMVDATEIRKTKSGDIFVFGRVACKNRKFGRWLGGFRGGPNDIWGFDRGVGKVIDGGEFADV